ncbi:MAG: deoxynucleoside kinase [Bacteroidales bacterium]|nr:deoxynucleoside kinase [Bacteroidales bacterium]
MSSCYIVIEGNIGAGKTTLAKKLAEDLKGRLILERFAENPFLPKFYENPSRWAFPCELSFLANRYYQLKNELLQPSLFDNFIISDYYFIKSLIFSKETLQIDEFRLFSQLFDIIYPQIPKPDIFVYLHAPVYKLQKQIKKRGRIYEQQISDEYLLNIQNNYFEYINNYRNQINFLIIDTEYIDFVENITDYYKIKEQILSNLKCF